MAAKRDYYEVLGVSKDADAKEIKAQYRKLALKFHPDRNKSKEAPQHFKEISEAYAVLSDTEKRKVYDRGGHAGLSGQYSQEDIFRGGGFSDIFDSVFGGGGFGDIFGNAQRQVRGSNIFKEVTIDLEDVLHGKDIHFKARKNVLCVTCRGSGCRPGTDRVICRSCRGQGQIKSQRRMGFASFVTMSACQKCKGVGKIVESPCRECKGMGSYRKEQLMSVTLPRGLEASEYRVPGAGDQVPSGANGDLIIRLHIRPHQIFRRDGSDIYQDLHISILDAILGGKFDVPTLEGDITIKVKSGSQPNTVIKSGGKGLPRMNGWGRGDMYTHVVIDIPKKINRKQKRLLEEFIQAE